MMNILEPILTRRSIRKYKNTPVSDEAVQTIIEAARLAPSGNNTQPWNFIVVRSDDMRKRIVEVSNNQTWMLQAPVFIACVADVRSRIREAKDIHIDENSPGLEVKQIIRDIAISIEHLVLQAQAIGLGTCWVAFFDQKDIRPVLNVPEDKYVVAVITVGEADEHPQPRPRRAFEDIIFYENWGSSKAA